MTSSKILCQSWKNMCSKEFRIRRSLKNAMKTALGCTFLLFRWQSFTTARGKTVANISKFASDFPKPHVHPGSTFKIVAFNSVHCENKGTQELQQFPTSSRKLRWGFGSTQMPRHPWQRSNITCRGNRLDAPRLRRVTKLFGSCCVGPGSSRWSRFP